MNKEFEMRIRENWTSSLDFTSSNIKMACLINQVKYLKERLKKYELDSLKHAKTSMTSNCKLHLNSRGKSTPEKVYTGMIRSDTNLAMFLCW